MSTFAADKRLIFRDGISGLFQPPHHVAKTVNDEGRVCFTRWNEVFLNPEVNLKRAAFKPATAALD